MSEVFKPLFAVHVLYVQHQKLDPDYQHPIPADHLWEAVKLCEGPNRTKRRHTERYGCYFKSFIPPFADGRDTVTES